MDTDKSVTTVVSILLGVIGLAIIATLVSSKSQTSNVLTAFGDAIKKILCVATSPITGGSCGSLTESVNSIFKPL